MAGELLIGLAGRARVGKDTAATLIEQRYGLEAMRFADPIKQVLKDLFDLEADHLDGALKEQPLPLFNKSPRELFQTLGDWGREHVHPEIWVHVARLRLARCRAIYADQGAPFVGALWSDVRLEIEAEWIRSQGGLVIHIERPGAPRVASHITEAGVEHRPGDALITNKDTIEAFYHKLTDMIDRYLSEYGQIKRGHK